MLATTHLVVTILLIMILNLNRNETMVALTFGVFIDLDHLYGYGSYIRSEGIGGIINVSGMMEADVQWKSILHNPITFGMIAPLSHMFKIFFPVIFWSVHIFMDFIQQSWLGIASPFEIMLFGIVIIFIVILRLRNTNRTIRSWRELHSFIVAEFDGLAHLFSGERINALSWLREKTHLQEASSCSSSRSRMPGEYCTGLRNR